MDEDKENANALSTRTHARKRQRKQQHQTRVGIQEATNELQFYELTVPVEQKPEKRFKLEVEPDFIEGVYPLYPDMTGDNQRKDFNLNRRQLKQMSKFKYQQKKRLDELEEQERFYPGDRFGDVSRDQISDLPAVDDLTVTKTEEEEILERAELYALTAAPDGRFYILESHDAPLDLSNCAREFNKEIKFPGSNPGNSTSYGSSRKRKRRSYNNINCYVTHHNKKDASDNTHMLPEGTRLIKPPNKLVELVAQVLDSSPDGLLQVQHIYTVLQNKYPYFRYMDKSSINSWRSSIRHALYQKWFKKVRFQTDSINSKGCFWAINRKYNPKEWTMPRTGSGECGFCMDEDGSLGLDLDLDSDESLAAVASMLAECEPLLENDSDYGSEEQQDFSAHIDQMIAAGGNRSGRQFSLPASFSTDPDPVLTSCSSTVEEPAVKIELCNHEYMTGRDTPVLGFQDEQQGYHTDPHCIQGHDWNGMWDSDSCPHLSYSQQNGYCWDYTSQGYPVYAEHQDGIPVEAFGYPGQLYLEDHGFS